MLLTTKDELRTHVPVGLALEMYTIAPAAATIEEKEVAQVIGEALYDDLVAAYGDGTQPIVEAKYATLLPYAQKIIANLAVAEAMDISQVQISESGVLRTEKDDEKTAYHYQKLEAQNALRRAGYQAQEDLLSYLGRTLVTYPEYEASEAYKQAQGLFITSAREFDQQYNINGSARTYRALIYLMRRAEQLQVADTIGSALFNELKMQQADNNLTPDNKSILVYIRQAVAHLAIADAAHELSLEVTPQGVQLSQTLATGGSSEEKKQAPRRSLDQLSERTEGLGRRYLEQLRGYLLDNASAAKYAAFYNSTLYPKAQEPEGPRDTPPGIRKIYGAL